MQEQTPKGHGNNSSQRDGVLAQSGGSGGVTSGHAVGGPQLPCMLRVTNPSPGALTCACQPTHTPGEAQAPTPMAACLTRGTQADPPIHIPRVTPGLEGRCVILGPGQSMSPLYKALESSMAGVAGLPLVLAQGKVCLQIFPESGVVVARSLSPPHAPLT